MPPLKLVAETLSVGPWQSAQLYVVVIAVASAGWLWRLDRRKGDWPHVAVRWWIWHWVTGGTLEVGRSTPPDTNRGWHILRRCGHALWRCGLLGLVVFAEWLRAGTNPTATAVVLVAAPILTITVTSYVAHYVKTIRPLHLAVHEPCGWPQGRWALRYLVVPLNLAEGGRKGVVVKVPPNFDLRDKSRDRVITTVIRTLDLGDCKVNMVHRGRRNYFSFQPKAKIPTSALYVEPVVQKLLENHRPSAPVMGLTYGNKPVRIDLDVESPHIMFSAGTGGGKSSLVRTVLAQLMRDGAEVTVLDLRRNSHRWMKTLPGVTYVRELGDMHDRLCWLAEEGNRRNRLLDEVDIGDPEPFFVRHILVFEEMNSTMGELQDWWRNYKRDLYPELAKQTVSPAVRAWRQLLFMGRVAKMHCVPIAQMGSARDVGGGEARENMTARVIARHTDRAWKMLVPEYPYHTPSRHPGRVFVCIAGEVFPTQAIYLTEMEARAYVAEVRGTIAHPKTPTPIDVSGVPGLSNPVALGKRSETVPELDPALIPVDLKEASADLGVAIVAMNHQALRKAILRARVTDEAPPIVGRRGNADLYLPHDLQRFEQGRPYNVRRADVLETSEGDGVDRTGRTNRA